MNVATSFIAYLGLFFVMIALALLNVIPVNYLGGIVIALFIGSLVFAWLNAWRQTEDLVKKDVASQPRLEKEEIELESEYPSVLVPPEERLSHRPAKEEGEKETVSVEA